MPRFISPRFNINNIEWKCLELPVNRWEEKQVSIKFTLTLDKLPETIDLDDTLSFVLIALDNHGFAVFELEFNQYHFPTDKNSREITQRFDCPPEVYNLISRWETK